MLHSNDGDKTVSVRCLISVALAAVGAAALGCGNRTAQAPNAVAFAWPDHFAYRLDYVSEAQRDRQPIVRYVETRTARFVIRDGQYLVGFDSVLKTNQRPGEPLTKVPDLPEDTLAFYAKIGRHGELTDVAPGCDPALPECRRALPSVVLMELRRVIPRLPLWEAPRGGHWVDTLNFDDASRPRGTRGSVVTSYGGRGDTIIGGRSYWLIGWRSVRHSWRGDDTGPTLGAEPPVEEAGMTFVDKQLLLPVFSTWGGAVPAPPEARVLGATGTGFRGRAYLAGTIFDSLYSRQLEP